MENIPRATFSINAQIPVVGKILAGLVVAALEQIRSVDDLVQRHSRLRDLQTCRMNDAGQYDSYEPGLIEPGASPVVGLEPTGALPISPPHTHTSSRLFACI